MRKIEEQELKKIKELNELLNSLVTEIGNIEINRISIEFQYSVTKSKILDLRKEESNLLEKLSKKYGDVMINPETGFITEPNK
jgi:hypothetical protein